MIPMSCPSCGRRGNVPLDRLNTRMHCKKCDAVFHLDATGKPLLGPPPTAKGKKGKPKEGDPHEPTDYIGMFFSSLAKLPKAVWGVLGAGVGIYALYLLFVTFVKEPDATPTQIYNRRAMEVAKSFLDKDASAMSYMAAPGTEKEAGQLVEAHRADVGDGKTSSEDITVLPGNPPAEVNATTPAETEITFLLPSTAANKASPIFYFRVHWLYIKGQLVVEGKKTLESAEKAAAEKKKKK